MSDEYVRLKFTLFGFRVMENINGHVKLGSKYEQVDVHVLGKLQQWRTSAAAEMNGGRLLVKVFADIKHQKWHVKLKGNHLYAPVQLCIFFVQ